MSSFLRIFAFAATVMILSSPVLVRLTHAQPDNGKSQPAPQGQDRSSAAKGIEPVWQRAVAGIDAKLKAALELYKACKMDQAKKAVTAAHFEGYKNSLLETAVRKHISQRKDFANNGLFTEIITLMGQNAPAPKIDEAIATLNQSLKQDLPGLPLVEGAVPKEMLEAAKRRIPEKDWRKVSEEVAASLGGAVTTYRQGKQSEALELAKETYFDNYDETGLEAKIDSVSHDANAKLGNLFNKLVHQMDTAQPEERIEQTADELKTEIRKVAGSLGAGHSDESARLWHRVTGSVRAWFQ